jgi:hypothetical protein
MYEPYQVETPGDLRRVQYFDKSRMEINCLSAECPESADASSLWHVTNGLLVVEMVEGHIRLGSDTFDDSLDPATMSIVGDPAGENGSGPTYADLGTWNLLEAEPYPIGTELIFKVGADGAVTEDASLAPWAVTSTNRVQVPSIDHTVASVFWDFMTSTGLVYEDGAYVEDQLFENPYYSTGYPITEAYWTRVNVGGTAKDVLFQCFERRCLTYTPGNPGGWKVEPSNVGQHYYQWRYTDSLQTAVSNYEENILAFLKRSDSQIFDSIYFDSLPGHYDQYYLAYRWFVGAYLTNTALVYALNGDSVMANEYLAKSWSYTKDINPSLSAPSQQSTAVFPIIEYVFALRVAGHSFYNVNPAMVLEILTLIRNTANARALETPVGNPTVPDSDHNSIKINSYVETLAGYADLLMGAASLMPSDENKDVWISKASEYAMASFSLGEPIGTNSSVRTAYVEDGDIKTGNHCWPFHPSYQLTSVGALGQGEWFAKTSGLSPGIEFRHNTDWAVHSVMHVVDEHNLYTISWADDTRGKDDWLEDWKNQLWSAYINDAALIAKKSIDMLADHNIDVITTKCGIWSPTFQATVDSKFIADTIIMLKGVDIYRKLIQLFELQERLGIPLHIGTIEIQLFSV